MGKDAHWASDIVGSAFVGAGTTELLFYLHRHRDKPTSLVILPMLPGQGAPGVSVSFTWEAFSRCYCSGVANVGAHWVAWYIPRCAIPIVVVVHSWA